MSYLHKPLQVGGSSSTAMNVGSGKNSLVEVLDFIRHEFDGVSAQAEQARRDIVEYSSHGVLQCSNAPFEAWI
jgi:hypothetical protein